VRSTHNTPTPEEQDFPIPDDCTCEDEELCSACTAVIAKDLEAQAEEMS
jgi:hypothetical protein